MPSSRRGGKAAGLAAVLLLLAAAGCNLIIGNHDAPLRDGGAGGPDGGGGGPDSTPDASDSSINGNDAQTGPEGTGADVAFDSPIACNPDASHSMDPHNCGSCGHDCLGGGCTGGQCQPVAVDTDASCPRFLTADPPFLYWADTCGTGPDIAQCADPPHCSPSAVMTQASGVVTAISAGGGAQGGVFWADEGFGEEISSCPAGGCGGGRKHVVSSGLGAAVGALSGDARVLYWGLEGSPGGLGWFSEALNTLGSSPSPADVRAVASSFQWVGWSGPGGVFVCPGAATAMSTTNWCPSPAPAMSAPAAAADVAIGGNGSKLLWTDGLGVHVCPLPCTPSNSSMLANGTQFTSVVADTTTAYWLEPMGIATSALYKCPLSGCAPSGPTFVAMGIGSDLAMDSAALYWVGSPGIRMLAK